MCQEIIGINTINLQEEINMYYNKFKNNIYSQNGEDGVLQEIIKELHLNVQDMWLVDVGAYDGISYSNFRKLIEQGANAVLIEPCLVGGACEEKYLKLQHLPKEFPKVKTLNHFTKINNKQKSDNGYNWCQHSHEMCGNYNFSPPQKTLDESLSEIKNFLVDYDILNIDIDSYDHDVWNEHKYNPKIVLNCFLEIPLPVSDTFIFTNSPSNSITTSNFPRPRMASMAFFTKFSIVQLNKAGFSETEIGNSGALNEKKNCFENLDCK